MREIIQKIVKDMIKPTILVGKVTAVDESNWTITVLMNDNDLELDSVRITSVISSSANTGIFIKPKINSYILVGLIDGSMNSMFVAKYSEIDMVQIIVDDLQLNGDANGGLIMIEDLKRQWDSNVVAIKSSCVAGFTALAGLDGSASLNAFNAASSGIKALNKSTLENTKVKHG